MKGTDLSGQKFAKLIVIKRTFNKVNLNGSTHIMFVCRCDCGKLSVIYRGALLSGRTKSCGCDRYLHRMTNTSEFKVWTAMKNRCTNPKNEAYKDYGGRGISVCARWLSSFSNFFEDVGIRPSVKHTLDRINNDGNYEKFNCRWASKLEQGKNKRNNIFVTYREETKHIAEWARYFNVTGAAIYYRYMVLKMSSETIFDIPFERKGRKKHLTSFLRPLL